VRQKLAVGLLIVALVTAGATIWLLKWLGVSEKAFGFPSAVGQSLTYGIYQNDNKVGAITQTVAEWYPYLNQYLIMIEVSDSENVEVFVKKDGRVKGIYDYILLSQLGEPRRFRREMWSLSYTANSISITIVEDENGAVGEIDMPENFVCKWEDYYFRFGKEPLSPRYSKRFNFVAQIVENFPGPGVRGTVDVIFTSRTARVIKEERLMVPAGTFDCYVVEIAGGGAKEDLFIWVDKHARITVQWKSGRRAAKLENYSGF